MTTTKSIRLNSNIKDELYKILVNKMKELINNNYPEVKELISLIQNDLDNTNRFFETIGLENIKILEEFGILSDDFINNKKLQKHNINIFINVPEENPVICAKRSRWDEFCINI